MVIVFTYLLKTKETIVVLTEKNYKEKLLTLFADCPLTIERLKDKQYGFDELAPIVEEYYNCDK